MSLTADNYSKTLGSVNQSAKTQSVTFRRSAECTDAFIDTLYSVYGYSKTSTTPSSYTDLQSYSGTFPYTLWNDAVANLDCDETYWWRAKATSYTTSLYETHTSAAKSFKTYAVDPTISTPSLSGETSSSVTVDGTWTPGTSETTVGCYVQYKKSSDGTWTTFGQADSDSGYSSLNIDSTVVTGLDPETSYDFRLRVYRPDCSNPTTVYDGSSASTSTTAYTPIVTTNAASSVAHNSATLSATVDHNTVDGNLSWRYDTSDPGTPDDTSGTEVSYASNPITEDGSGTYGISGLSASTTYYFWAIYQDLAGNNDRYYGDVLSFETAGDPAVEAADEDLMITQYVDGQYGVATTVYFTLRQPAATSSNAYYTGSAPVQADVKIVQDGTYDSTSDNAPAQVDAVNSPQLYSLEVSAAEMQADVIDVMIVDAAGSAFRDHHIQIRTQQNLGTIVVNAANKATNTDAVTYTGNGTGAGLKAVGGDNDGADIEAFMSKHTLNWGTVAAYNSSTSVDLDNSSQTGNTNDIYNGSIIIFFDGSGTGQHQARIITDYNGTTYEATLHRALETAVNTSTKYIIIPGSDLWTVSPGEELSAVPTKTSGYGDILMGLFQRFFFKRTQTATTFTMFKADSATSLTTGSVDDDGTTQTHSEIGSQ